MLPARTYSISIDRDWRALYDSIWLPDVFPKWASGLAESNLRQESDRWMADGPEGPVTIRFTPHNAFGLMDHYVDAGNGQEIHVPLRVIANGEGAEVMLTLFRQPGMDDEMFARDAKWITRDLRALKAFAMA
ncbi:MAG: polyketide cyclase [Sphingomonadales bacterium GWF1_63_6]|nr:MAG: polyketide cyclase [Sphingomonadales bacterium GWF1_63_6]